MWSTRMVFSSVRPMVECPSGSGCGCSSRRPGFTISHMRPHRISQGRALAGSCYCFTRGSGCNRPVSPFSGRAAPPGGGGARPPARPDPPAPGRRGWQRRAAVLLLVLLVVLLVVVLLVVIPLGQRLGPGQPGVATRLAQGVRTAAENRVTRDRMKSRATVKVFMGTAPGGLREDGTARPQVYSPPRLLRLQAADVLHQGVNLLAG